MHAVLKIDHRDDSFFNCLIFPSFLPSFLLLHPNLSIWGGMIHPLLFCGLHIISCRKGIEPFYVISTPNLHRDTGKQQQQQQQQHWCTPSVGYSFPSSTTCTLSIANTFPSFTGERIRRIDNKGEDLYYYE